MALALTSSMIDPGLRVLLAELKCPTGGVEEGEGISSSSTSSTVGLDRRALKEDGLGWVLCTGLWGAGTIGVSTAYCDSDNTGG